MGCSCCKKSRKPTTDETSISKSLLLDESTDSKSCFDVNDNNSKSLITDNELESPKLIPSIQQLQTLIFKYVCNNYDLFPQYGKLSSFFNSTQIAKEKSDISSRLLNICFLIALSTNGPNVSYINNISYLLDYNIKLHYNMILLPELIQLITTFIGGITFNNHLLDSDLQSQLQFSYSNSIVKFKYMDNDYLNLRSNEYIIGSNVLINCYILSKGDEMWIGILNNNTYNITDEIEKKYGSLFYYGGRERNIINKYLNSNYSKWDNGFGAIHGFQKIIQNKLPYYRKGDWISFLINTDQNNSNCTIYKNGGKVFQINKLPFLTKPIINNFDSGKSDLEGNDSDSEDSGLYFCAVVDDSMDGFMVEQVMYTDNIL